MLGAYVSLLQLERGTTMNTVMNAQAVGARLIDLTLVHRVRAEYDEMPGLHLTDKQAARLWGCDRETCRTVMAALEEAGFLTRTRTGAFVRV